MKNIGSTYKCNTINWKQLFKSFRTKIYNHYMKTFLLYIRGNYKLGTFRADHIQYELDNMINATREMVLFRWAW